MGCVSASESPIYLFVCLPLGTDQEGVTVGVFFMILFFFIAILIVGLVLLQEGKGGGLTGMSTGMDGVMGAKNPLRRMTAYLFTVFVLMCLAINWYFYERTDQSLPVGAPIPVAQRVLEEEAPGSGPMVVTDSLPPAETPATPAAAPEAETASPAETSAAE